MKFNTEIRYERHKGEREQVKTWDSHGGGFHSICGESEKRSIGQEKCLVKASRRASEQFSNLRKGEDV